MVEQERINQQPDNKHGNAHNRPQNRRARLRAWIRVRWRWVRIRRWQIGRWATLVVLIVGGLIAASRYVSGDTDPIQFVTGNLLNVLIFCAIVAQVLIYRKQRDIMRHQWRSMQSQLSSMDRQERAMRDQVKVMSDALVIGHAAYVSIHSVESEMKTGAPIAIRIENVGKVPAEEIEIHIDLVCAIKPSTMNTPNKAHPIWYTRTQHFGRMKLFCGDFKIPILMSANTMFFSEELDLIVKNHIAVVMRGRIGWQDGFQQGRQEVEFAFFYVHNAHSEKDEWLPSSPATWDNIFQAAYKYPARGHIEENPS